MINTETGEIVDEVAKLTEWHNALEAAIQVKSVIEKEQALRKEVASLFFPNPKEGTNTVDLAGGFKLKLTYKIDRKLDEAALPTIQQQLREFGVNPDPLVTMKPDLDTKAYKSLVQVNKDAASIFGQCIISKPASPTLEIVPPKSK